MAKLKRGPRLALCALLAALAYGVGLGRAGLWEPDEGRYGEIAREMVASGDYVTPRNDWVPYFEKPPLVYWTTAAALETVGDDEFAVRLQAALASIGTVVVTAMLGEAMFGAAVGMLAAAALGLSPLFFIFARFATPDPLLAFCFTAALAAFYGAATSGDFHEGRSRRLMLAAAGLTALGTLTKGLVALALAGMIGATWLLWERRGRDLLRIRWLECAALYLVIVAPWFALAEARNPGFLRFFIVHEHVQRFLADTEHGWGPWFFVPIVIAGTWPWILFAPLGMGCGQGGSAAGEDEAAAVDGESAAEVRGRRRFLAVWFAAVLVFFSIPRSKLGEYILPGLPPLAILAAYGLEGWRRRPPRRAERVANWYAGLNLAVGIAAAVAGIAFGSWSRNGGPAMATDLRRTFANDAVLLGLVLGVGGAAFWGAARRCGRRAAAVVVAATAAALAGVIAQAQIALSEGFSYRSLARTIEPYLDEGCGLASYHHYTQALPFYTARREQLVGYRGELAPFADTAGAAASFIGGDRPLRAKWSGAGCTVLIVNRQDWARLQGLLEPAAVVGCEGKKLAVINRGARDASVATGCDQAQTRSQKP